MDNTPRSLPIFFVLFVTSGATGLIYESLWADYLALFLGHAAYAQSFVLVLFMGGMAVGSWLVSQRQISNPLLLYAIVEGCIGIFAVAFHALFVFMTESVYAVYSSSPVLGEGLRWLVCVVLVGPAAVLLGATFPLIVTGLLRRYQVDTGRLVALLYFFNSLGAAVGVLIGGFWLIERFGLPGTMLFAGIVNLGLALIVYLLIRRSEPKPAHVSSGSLATPDAVRVLLLVSLLTGFASFIYEIAWIRMLSLVLGASNHAFEMMLSAFVLGLALGGFWIRNRISQLAQPIVFLGKIQIVMGVMAMLSMLAYEQSFHWMEWAMLALTKNDAGYFAFNVISHGIAMLVMLPTTFCAGMTLPIITNRLLASAQGERAVGRVYAVNTLGAILGVLVSVQILMPLIGLQNLLTVGAAIDVGVGCFLFYYCRWPRMYAGGITALVLCITIYSQVDFASERLVSGVFRDGSLSDQVDSVFHKDGKTATVDVYDTGDLRVIATNGKTDASVALSGELSPDEYTMVLLGALPLILNPDAKDVAVVGMGSGITSHTMLASPAIERLDTVEIESAMIAGARYFNSTRAFSDPRSNLVVDDAKAFFAKNGQTYDLIVSEPSNPWVSGVASVFSLEFYQTTQRYLKPEGLFVQWLHVYESNDSLVFSVLNAIGESFSNYDIYLSVDGDVIIVAGETVPSLTGHHLSQPLRESLGRIEVNNIDDLKVRFLASKEHIELLSPLYPEVNTDYFPYLDLHATRARFKNMDATVLLDLRTSLLPVSEIVTGEYGAPTKLQLTPTASEANVLLQLAMQAKMLARAITEPQRKESELSAFDQRLLFDVMSFGLACEQRIDITLWEESMMGFAGTLLFLSPEELAPVWVRLSQHQCRDVASDRAFKWINLLDALSRRQADRVVVVAESLLDGRDMSTSIASFLLTAKVMAIIAQGDYKLALRLFTEHELVGEHTNIAIKLLYLHALHENGKALSGQVNM